jgi:hypothetical protein
MKLKENENMQKQMGIWMPKKMDDEEEMGQ